MVLFSILKVVISQQRSVTIRKQLDLTQFPEALYEDAAE
jgi:hypothetical protein